MHINLNDFEQADVEKVLRHYRILKGVYIKLKLEKSLKSIDFDWELYYELEKKLPLIKEVLLQKIHDI